MGIIKTLLLVFVAVVVTVWVVNNPDRATSMGSDLWGIGKGFVIWTIGKAKGLF